MECIGRYNRWGKNATGDNEDHDNDPLEFRNLSREPTYIAVLEEIRAQFDETRGNARAEPP